MKGNHDCDGVWIIYLMSVSIDFIFSFTSLVLVLIGNIHQTLKTVYDHFQTPQRSTKLLCCTPFFQLSSPLLVFGTEVKQSKYCYGHNWASEQLSEWVSEPNKNYNYTYIKIITLENRGNKIWTYDYQSVRYDHLQLFSSL